MLKPSEAREYYDRFGIRQDEQGFYEDRALAALTAQLDLANAASVVELGCGTGRLALDLLGRRLPACATYAGIDISDTMVAIAQQRLAVFGERAVVVRGNGALELPCGRNGCDRVIAAYVLDLLGTGDSRAFIREAYRVLARGGLIGIAGLTHGENPVSRAVSVLWRTVQRVWPRRVGGCRPVEAAIYLDAGNWSIVSRRVVTQSAIPSEVVVARKL